MCGGNESNGLSKRKEKVDLAFKKSFRIMKVK